MIEVLVKLVSGRGAPRYLRSDNGSEFVSRAVLRWLSEANIETALIDPDTPWQKGAAESFNGKLHHECLSLQWFNGRSIRYCHMFSISGRSYRLREPERAALDATTR